MAREHVSKYDVMGPITEQSNKACFELSGTVSAAYSHV
jgi:hypothetical protein